MANTTESKNSVASGKEDDKLPSVTVLSDEQFETLLKEWTQRMPPMRQRAGADEPAVVIEIGDVRVALPTWLKGVPINMDNQIDPRFFTLLNLIDLARVYSPNSYRLNTPPVMPVAPPNGEAVAAVAARDGRAAG